MGFKIFLWFLIFLVLYRFAVRFLFPILKITRNAQNRIKQMENEMRKQQQYNQHQQHQQAAPEANRKHSIDGDYIDYEELEN